MRTYEEIAADAEDRRPFSNSTEYEIWANDGKGCYDCRNDSVDRPVEEKFCPILSVAVTGSWPKEWMRRTVESRYGSYEVVDECVEFDEWRDDDGPDDPEPEPEPPPVIEGQVDMFEVFAEQVVDAIPAPIGALR